MTDKQQFVIASIEDFDHSEIVQLPSQQGTNKAVRLQQPDLVQLFSDGDAPDLLSSIALGHLNGGDAAHVDFKVTKDNLPDLLKTLNLICRACFVEPKIWNGRDKIKSDEIAIEHISFNDRMFVFNWALGAEYQPAKNFPDEAGTDMGDLQSGNGVSEPTKQLTDHS